MTEATPLDKLKAELFRIHGAIGKIEDRERRATNRKLIGNTYKCRNNYSCPEKPSDYWWLYIQVDRLDSDGHLKCFSFQTDKYGQITIRPEDHMYGHQFDYDNYKKITKAEFKRAWRSLLARVKAQRG